MSLKIESAVVIDDAIGAPATGTIASEDKDAWIDAVADDEDAQAALWDALYDSKPQELDGMLDELTGQHSRLDQLWGYYSRNELAAAQLGVLFRSAVLHRQGKIEKAQVVVDKLSEIIGEEKVYKFSDIDSASKSLASADVAFVDFFLSDSESEDAAIARITAAATQLQGPKLLFFMSSRASLNVQQSVRKQIGVRAAFFDVIQKRDITHQFIADKLDAKRDSYASNDALRKLVQELVHSTTSALKEFEEECEELEVHDLQMLDLVRLDAEGESLGEYLTWLFSESVAAKTRRLAAPQASQQPIQVEAIGFTGQIRQGKVLSDLFAEIVFGPSVEADKPIRFGELLRYRNDSGVYILVLTPACDLQRCEASKPVLCVEGVGEAVTGSKFFAREKLYGKQDDGHVCHLLGANESRSTTTMIRWKHDRILTLPAQDLLSDKFERVALMNELFAQEVKEQVLREVGRVGTQIDPPPAQALDAKIRWKKYGKDYDDAAAPKEAFVSALLSYSERGEGGKRKALPMVVLSDEFLLWLRAQIEGSVEEGQTMNVKCRNSLDAALSGKQFQLPKGFVFKDQGLVIRVVESDDESVGDGTPFLEITLLPSNP
ncbi:MAG: hypothetical protein P8014_05285 [Acidihalobacter sp.]|uniref:hypothetical protein n=1 Tax=Acidihalobacter sp. TaxID=1872108 RepID=UPI00307FC3A4